MICISQESFVIPFLSGLWPLFETVLGVTEARGYIWANSWPSGGMADTQDLKSEAKGTREKRTDTYRIFGITEGHQGANSSTHFGTYPLLTHQWFAKLNLLGILIGQLVRRSNNSYKPKWWNGRHKGLREKLSAPRETSEVELLKVGGT